MRGRILAAVAGIMGAVVLVFPAATGNAAAKGSAGEKRGPSASWPQYGSSASRQFYQPDETILGRKNVAKLTRVFLTAGRASSNPPVLAGGILYESACVVHHPSGLYNCRITAQNASNGAIVWSHQLLHHSGAPSLLPVAVDRGMVFVPFVSGKLEAIDAATGESVLWTAHLPLVAVPAIADGTVFAAGANGKLYALSEATGARLWAVKLGPSTSQPPAVAGGVVYAGSDDGILHALNAATGAQLWSANVEGPLTVSPSVGDGMVFASAGTTSGRSPTAFYAFDAKSGALSWKFTGGPQSQLQWAAVDPDHVYLVNNFLAKVDVFAARTGQELWTATPHEGDVVGVYEPVVANGVLYVGTNYAIYAYNTKTGALLATIPFTAGCTFPQYTDGLAIANGVLYSDCEAWALPKGSH